jgi:hypothetical protein
MPKNKVSEWSVTASSNTDIGGININEGCPPSGINNAIRELMAQVRDFQLGADGDGLTVSTLNATTATIGNLIASSFGAITATSASISGALTTATANITTATIGTIQGTVSGLTVTTLRVLGETTGTTATFGAVTATTLNVSGSVTGTTATFGPVVTDVISENTSDAGVTVDGLLIKDGVIAASAVPITRETAIDTTSGTTATFTGIPSWVRRITVVFNQISIDSTDNFIVQIGTSGGLLTSGYASRSSSAGSNATSTAGFVVRVQTTTGNVSGIMTIVNVSGNIWISSHAVDKGTNDCPVGGGVATLSGVLTQVRLTTELGVNFDNGSVNILYE